MRGTPPKREIRCSFCGVLNRRPDRFTEPDEEFGSCIAPGRDGQICGAPLVLVTANLPDVVKLRAARTTVERIRIVYSVELAVERRVHKSRVSSGTKWRGGAYFEAAWSAPDVGLSGIAIGLSPLKALHLAEKQVKRTVLPRRLK